VAASVDCLLANSQASGGSSTTDLELGPQTPPGNDKYSSNAGRGVESLFGVSCRPLTQHLRCDARAQHLVGSSSPYAYCLILSSVIVQVELHMTSGRPGPV
jgi:hypothetical protein